MATSIPGIPAADRRRGERVLIRLPIRVNGITKQGKRVSEKAEAVVVSRHGALLKTESDLKPGTEVDVENPGTQQNGKFRVVWTSDRPTEGRWDIGLETSAVTSNLWGIEFPPPGSQKP